VGPLQGGRELHRLRFIDTRLTQSLSREDTKVSIDGRDFVVGVPEATRQTLPMMVPLGRAGTPEEAAGAVYLFCIPESDYISGQVIIVGGGISM
jgi:3-oxoacyl-[acyl-carrier protein] reductase